MRLEELTFLIIVKKKSTKVIKEGMFDLCKKMNDVKFAKEQQNLK